MNRYAIIGIVVGAAIALTAIAIIDQKPPTYLICYYIGMALGIGFEKYAKKYGGRK